MFSVQAMTLATSIQGTWALLPDDLKPGIPPKVVHIICAVILVAGIVGRLMQQDKVTGEK